MDRFKKVYSQGTLNVVEIWVDTETGVNFRLHGTVDQDTLVRIAGSVKEK